MEIFQLFSDNQLRNFSYLIKNDDSGIYCVDPFGTVEIVDRIEELDGNFLGIINTHQHFDHVAGNDAIINRFGGTVFNSENLLDGEVIKLGDQSSIRVIGSPGHTHNDLSLFVEDGELSYLISGDTLFNAGVGNCNFGDPKILYRSVDKILNIVNDKTVLFPGHDYLETNLRFSLNERPDDKYILDLLKKVVESGTIVTDFSIEKKINCFFNCSEKDFLSLRERRNSW